MADDILRKTLYWQKSAESDLSAVDALFKSGNYPQMAFFCHLAVEKYLKAYFWHNFKKNRLIYTMSSGWRGNAAFTMFFQKKKKNLSPPSCR